MSRVYSGKYDEQLAFGSKYGRLVSTGIYRSGSSHREYMFLCDCGEVKWVGGVFVVRGSVQSCGCLSRNQAADRCSARSTHGLSSHPLMGVWNAMMSRCTNPRNKSYERYGGRGIKVCDRWLEFEAFFEDVCGLWFVGSNMDRIDNSEGYAPGNVRFVSPKENQRNRTNNRLITIDGVAKCTSEWAESFGINQNLFRQRIDRDGLSPIEALHGRARS